MKAAELRTKTVDELNDQLVALKKEQFNTRFQKTMGQTENLSKVRQSRRVIARIKTILTERNKADSSSKKGK